MGSSPAALKRQIQGEIAWSMLLRRNVTPFINVSAEEVEETMTRLKESRGQYEYRLAEIYLSATPETAATVEQNAAQIIQQIRQGGSFQAYARQYSESTTAAVGGAAHRELADRLAGIRIDIGRNGDHGCIVVDILGVVGVEAALDHDLAADARFGGVVAQHRALDFAPDYGGFDQHLVVECQRQ